MELWPSLAEKVGVDTPSLRDVVLAISRMPYGRPSELSAAGVVREWRGTCSTKHVLLWQVMGERWPETEPNLWHRIYRVTQDRARLSWGDSVARVVPPDGLIDVHSFVTASIGEDPVVIDATFAVEDWDGRSAMRIWADAGQDVPAGLDPLGCKRALEREHCDPTVREPFIAAIVVANGQGSPAR